MGLNITHMIPSFPNKGFLFKSFNEIGILPIPKKKKTSVVKTWQIIDF